VNWTGKSSAEWEKILQERTGPQLVVSILKKYLPNRLAEGLCVELNFTEIKHAHLTKQQQSDLIRSLTTYKLPCTGHLSFKMAEVTGGGVPLNEINLATLESLVATDLYLCGEILDVFGRIGGFNFYWAWVTGRIAGLSSVTRILGGGGEGEGSGINNLLIKSFASFEIFSQWSSGKSNSAFLILSKS